MRIPQANAQLNIGAGTPNLSQAGVVAVGEAAQGFGSSLVHAGGVLNRVQEFQSDEANRMEVAQNKAASFTNDEYLLRYQTSTANVNQQAALNAGENLGLHDAGVNYLQEQSGEINARIAELEQMGQPALAAELKSKKDQVDMGYSADLRLNEFKLQKGSQELHLDQRAEGTIASTTAAPEINDARLQESLKIIDDSTLLNPVEKEARKAKLIQDARTVEANLRAGGDPELAASMLGMPIPDTGDKNFYDRMRHIESGGRDNAVSPTGATGRYQFIKSTWDGIRQRHPELGLTADGRTDPNQQERAVRALTKENRAHLRSALGREPTPGELYLAHQQGAGGAAKMLANPNQKAISIVGAQAIVVNGGNPNMTAGEFANLWISKFDGTTAPSYPATQGAADPRYAMLPIDSRQQIMNRTQAVFNANQQAQQEAANISYANQKGQIELGVALGTINSMEGLMAVGGGLRPGDLADFVNKINTQTKTKMEYANEKASSTVDGRPMNFVGADMNKQHQTLFEQAVPGGQWWNGAGVAATQQFMQQEGNRAAPKMLDDINTSLSSINFENPNTGLLKSQLAVLADMRNTAGIFRGLEKSGDAQGLLDKARTYESLGHTNGLDRAINEWVQDRDPKVLAAREKYRNTPEYTTTKKTIEQGELFLGGKLIAGVNDTVAVSDVQFQDNIQAEAMWNTTALRVYEQTGDIERAKTEANMELSKIYGVGEPMENGMRPAMLWSPEKLLPPLPDVTVGTEGIIGTGIGAQPTVADTHAWISNQAEELGAAYIKQNMPAEAALFGDNPSIMMVADANTERGWREYMQRKQQGVPDDKNAAPTYQLQAIDTEGVVHTIPVNFRPNLSAARIKTAADLNQYRVNLEQEKVKAETARAAPVSQQDPYYAQKEQARVTDKRAADIAAGDTSSLTPVERRPNPQNNPKFEDQPPVRAPKEMTADDIIREQMRGQTGGQPSGDVPPPKRKAYDPRKDLRPSGGPPTRPILGGN
jgi:hypothetical protein